MSELSKLYKETIDKLSAKDDVVYQVLQSVSSKRNTGREKFKKVLACTLAFTLVCGLVVVYAGGPAEFSGYVHYKISSNELRNKVFDYPENLGEYKATEIQRIDVVDKANDLFSNTDDEVLFEYLRASSPDRASYQYYVIDYTIGERYLWVKEEVPEEEGGGYVTSNVQNPEYKNIELICGTTNNDLWKYVFNFDDDGNFVFDSFLKYNKEDYWYDNFEELEYKGLKLFAADNHIKRFFDKNGKLTAEDSGGCSKIVDSTTVSWYDSEEQIVMKLSGDESLSRDEAIKYAKMVIDSIQ